MDRWFWQWQNIHPKSSLVDGVWKPYGNSSHPLRLEDIIPPYQATVAELSNTTELCYGYSSKYMACNYEWPIIRWLCEKNLIPEKTPSSVEGIPLGTLQNYVDQKNVIERFEVSDS